MSSNEAPDAGAFVRANVQPESSFFCAGPAMSTAPLLSHTHIAPPHTPCVIPQSFGHGVPSGSGLPTHSPLASQCDLNSQGLSDLQSVPAPRATSQQSPVPGEHDAMRQDVVGTQTLGSPTQAPPEHAGLTMHLSWVLHAAPFAAFAEKQLPFVASQTPTLHVAFWLEQSVAAPVHAPAALHVDPAA